MQLSELRGKSKRADEAFRWLAVAAAASVLIVLTLVASTMTERAIPVLSKMGLTAAGFTRYKVGTVAV